MSDIPSNNLELLNATLQYNKLKRRPLVKNLGTVSVSGGGSTVAHGLAKTPNLVLIQPLSNVIAYQTAVPDSTNIYPKVLNGDGSSPGTVNCNIIVLYLEDNIQ